MTITVIYLCSYLINCYEILKCQTSAEQFAIIHGTNIHIENYDIPLSLSCTLCWC